MSDANKLVLHDKDIESNLWVAAGIALAVLTLFVSFITCYGLFFERQVYINRKILYKYLKKNGVPKPTFCGEYKIFEIGQYEITLYDGGYDKKWYVYSKICGLVICSFHSGIIDSIRYRKVMKILSEA